MTLQLHFTINFSDSKAVKVWQMSHFLFWINWKWRFGVVGRVVGGGGRINSSGAV